MPCRLLPGNFTAADLRRGRWDWAREGDAPPKGLVHVLGRRGNPGPQPPRRHRNLRRTSEHRIEGRGAELRDG
jgi:hypothetical protein